MLHIHAPRFKWKITLLTPSLVSNTIFSLCTYPIIQVVLVNKLDLYYVTLGAHYGLVGLVLMHMSKHITRVVEPARSVMSLFPLPYM